MTLQPHRRWETGASLHSLERPDRGDVGCVWSIHRTIKTKIRTSRQEIYVVRNLSKPLLGRPAIQALNVAALIEPVEGVDIVKQFPELFEGLGKLPDSYQIKLREGAMPFALTVPRRVPVPLMPKVKLELERMERLGVITKINEPTDWCAGMVVVPKQNGKVRICVDLTKLYESVCRERHILPSVEQTLAQIGGANRRRQAFLRARRKLRILADTARSRFLQAYNVHYAIRAVLF